MNSAPMYVQAGKLRLGKKKVFEGLAARNLDKHSLELESATSSYPASCKPVDLFTPYTPNFLNPHSPGITNPKPKLSLKPTLLVKHVSVRSTRFKHRQAHERFQLQNLHVPSMR